jgi:hypothetical protein
VSPEARRDFTGTMVVPAPKLAIRANLRLVRNNLEYDRSDLKATGLSKLT